MASTLFVFTRRPSIFKPLITSPSLQKIKLRNYIESNESEPEIGEKARSTAEEFSRQAMQKADKVREGAEEAWDGAKEVVGAVDESQSLAKETFKENVEKGNYDKMGQN